MRLGKVRYESKYLAIKSLHTEKNWSIEWMCRHFEISRAAYYKWLHHKVPDEERETIKLAQLIKEYGERFHHIPGYRRKLYLSSITDLYDRYPVSYDISLRNDNRLVFKTFDKAIAANPDAKPILHSDRGFQYTGTMFKKKLEKQEMKQSMSRVVHCIDNGATEGFWGIIKSEMYHMYEITDEVSLRYAINDYIRFYSGQC